MTSLHRFALKVFLWLPLCFGAWYFASILLAVPLASVLDALMTWIFPDLVQAVMRKGNALLVVLRTEAIGAELNAATSVPAVAYPINPLIYGYSVPLYSALVLAAPGEDAEKMGRWILGMLILFLAQVFGLATEILKDLTFGIEAARAQLGLSSFGNDVLALAYQVGYLILPPVTPLVVWASQFRRQLADFVGSESVPRT